MAHEISHLWETVEGEGHVAVGAARHVATIAAQDEGGRSPPVEKKNGLLASLQALA
jgi:hypothetical protein